MEIVKLDYNIFKKSTDYQREQAKNTIAECVSKGIGMYEIKDNDSIFPSKQVMYERLKRYAYIRNCDANRKKENLKVEVITKNKKQQIIVVVKEL